MFAPLPSTVPSLNENRITPEKIDLGKALFFDPRMSASGVFSCNSCHNLATGGDDNMPVSIGHGWQKGPRNSPTVLNAVFNQAQFWDGRAPDLAEQAKGPVQAGVEMANTPDNVLLTLNSMPQYVEWFEASFPQEDEPVSFDNFAKAIEAYEATLITPSPFDAWLNGDDGAMTEEEVRGLQTFVDAGCASCHSGINLGGNGYYPFGLVERPGAEILPEGDKGRYIVTETVDHYRAIRDMLSLQPSLDEQDHERRREAASGSLAATPRRRLLDPGPTGRIGTGRSQRRSDRGQRRSDRGERYRVAYTYAPPPRPVAMARVPYAEAADVPDEYEDLLESSLQGKPLHVYQSIGNNPEVLAGLRSFLGSLWADSGLTDRERELVILAVASEVGNRYEWHQHVNIARGVGVDDDQIAALGRGDTDPFGEEGTTLVEYALAVVRGEVDAIAHDEVAALYDDETVVGIAAAAEGYDALGGLIDAFDLELEPGTEFHGWDPR